MVSAFGTLAVSYVMDWSLLRLTVALLDRKIRAWRLFLGASVATLPTLWVLLQQNLYATPWEVLVFWPLLSLLIATGRLSWRLWFRAYLLLVAATVLAGGIGLVVLTWIPRTLPGVPSWLILGMSVPPLLWAVGKFIPRPRIRQYFGQAQKGEISVVLDGRVLTVPCLWDSGNRMRDPVLRRPVIVMEVGNSLEWLSPEVLGWVTTFLAGKPSPVPQGWQGRLGSVLYQSIGGHGVLPVVAVEKAQGRFMARWYPLVPMVVAFTNTSVSTDHTYNALVSPDSIITLNQEGVGA